MYVAQPIEWTDRGVVMLDQRRLPAEEVSLHLHRLSRSRQSHPRDGDSRRAGDRRCGRHGRGAGCSAFFRRNPSKRSARNSTEICDVARENAPDGGRSFLGARAHEAPLRRTHRAIFRPREDQAGDGRRSAAGSSRKERHRRSHRPLRRGIHAARRPGHDPVQRRRARHRRHRHRARRHSRRRSSRDKNFTSSFPKRVPIFKARASPPGNSTKAASRSRSSPTTWWATS